MATSDKAGEEGEAILEAADRVDEFIVDPSIEAVLRPKVEGPGVEAALRHSIVYKLRQN